MILRIFKKYKYFLIFSFLVLSFFLPRFFTHLQYDALEDEMLSLDFNVKYSAQELLLAPDPAHPPLWYLLMDYPTELLGLSHGIIYYRLIQVLILFSGLLFTVVYFWKKIPHKFILIFLLLFLTNIGLVHLTSQHRMYSLVLSLGVFYSFYWFYLIECKTNKKWQDFSIVGVVAALGFFSNYSMIWLIPVFPLSYLFIYRDKLKIRIKNLLVFTTTFFLSIGWFIPTFIRNSLLSITSNQWAPDLNVYNSFQLFVNYFGIIPMHEDLGQISIFALIFIIIFILILVGQLFFSKKKLVVSILFSSVLSFLLFILTVFFTGNGLLYPRTAISLVLAFYVFIAGFFGNFKFSKILVLLVILLQLSQFLLYFNQDASHSKDYHFVDYRYNPIGYFASYDFYPRSCLVAIPSWNEMVSRYFLSNVMEVVSPEIFSDEELLASLKKDKCKFFYLLEQFSVNEERLNKQYKEFFPFDFKLNLLDQYENQNLYLLAF